jgi:pyruvate kinase
MLRNRKAKIVATVGPASNSEEMLETLYQSGVDLFRLNFSHGSHEDKLEVIQRIRKIEEKFNEPIGILADLQGPKFRIGEFANQTISLSVGQSFVLDNDETLGDESRVFLPHQVIFDNIKIGDDILLNDGVVKLEVLEVTDNKIETKVIYGEALSDKKGVNLPNTPLPLSALTPKDEVDLAFLLKQDIDWIALSFVQRADDIIMLKSIIKDHAKVMAKIEKPSAVTGLSDIVEAADGVMIARGDLGVELPSEIIPVITKKIIRECRQQGKPVLVATQMLESMINSPKPTRAEASDVASAIYDGADAVMLSAETAAGKYPLETVKIMSSIVKSTEEDHTFQNNMALFSPKRTDSIEDAICASLSQVTEQLKIISAVTYTSSGHTSLRAARERPDAVIVSITESLKVARQMTLIWGVYSVPITDQPTRVTDIIATANRILTKLEVAKSGDKIAITAGMPFGVPGTTNFLRICELD